MSRHGKPWDNGDVGEKFPNILYGSKVTRWPLRLVDHYLTSGSFLTISLVSVSRRARFASLLTADGVKFSLSARKYRWASTDQQPNSRWLILLRQPSADGSNLKSNQHPFLLSHRIAPAHTSYPANHAWPVPLSQSDRFENMNSASLNLLLSLPESGSGEYSRPTQEDSASAHTKKICTGVYIT